VADRCPAEGGRREKSVTRFGPGPAKSMQKTDSGYAQTLPQ
jgi:hypothetical protein